MSLARLVVTAVKVEGRSKAEVARDYGVSRRWVYELVRRFEAEGEAGLEPRSRRPRASPSRISSQIEDEIVMLRKVLSDQGLDSGAHTIAYHLHQVHGSAPAPSSIWRILQRRGFVTPQPQKRPKSSFIRFEADQPNERWQADITHWSLAEGTDVEILNIIDDHSRLLVACEARAITRALDVVATFHRAAAAHGFPASVLTDNEAVFTGVPRGGRSALESELASLGISHRRSRTYHPQTCGKVERLHQTLKRWLVKQRRARTVADLQTQLDRFTVSYNTWRPHRALGRRTPIEAFSARPKATPAAWGFEVPARFRVRRDRIDSHGVVTLRHAGRLHHIGIGRAHASTRVLVLVVDLDVRVVSEDGELLRELVLNPNRDYQARVGPS